MNYTLLNNKEWGRNPQLQNEEEKYMKISYFTSIMKEDPLPKIFLVIDAYKRW